MPRMNSMDRLLRMPFSLPKNSWTFFLSQKASFIRAPSPSFPEGHAKASLPDLSIDNSRQSLQCEAGQKGA